MCHMQDPSCVTCAAAVASSFSLQVAFFLSQLVQSLRADKGGQIGDALVQMARASDLFAHQVRSCAPATGGWL